MKRKINEKRRNKKICLSKVIIQIKRGIVNQKPDNFKDAVHIAMKTAHNLTNEMNISQLRVISILEKFYHIPIFAGLSALGALTGEISILMNIDNESYK